MLYPLLYRAVLVASLLLPMPSIAGMDADALMRAGRIAEAWQAARDEAAARPDDLDVQERQIDVALSLGLHHMVLPDLRQRVVDHPDDADGYYLLGRIALGAAEAKGYYRRALQLNPQHARAPMGLGAVLRAEGQPAEAAQEYRQALARDPSLTEAWAGLTAALLQQGDMPGAILASQQAVQAVPANPDGWIAAATLDPAKARELLGEGVRRVPNDARLRASLARAHLDAGQGKPAGVQARESLRLAPDYAEASYLNLVAVSLAEGTLDAAGWAMMQKAQNTRDPEAALAAWDALVQRHPRSALTWLGRGKVRGPMGDLVGAERDVRQALSLAPGEVEVRGTYGLILLRSGRAAEAIPHLKAASMARPSDVSLAMAVVEAQQATGDATKAREGVVDLLARNPHDLRVILLAARVIGDQGDREGAYLVLREALPRQPDPRLVVALAAAARDAGYLAEAADILDKLGRTLNIDKAGEIAEQLRAEAARSSRSATP